MTKTLIIELPDELEEKLKIQATQQNTSLEVMVLEWLTVMIQPADETELDPIAPLIGTLTADVNDIGEHHDIYLGNILKQELGYAD